tara:strand:+ start:111 stop:452 length:342 start_codon:yes stop_codon:yes gene_type:complete
MRKLKLKIKLDNSGEVITIPLTLLSSPEFKDQDYTILGEYIGINDKDGVEVYSGDILSSPFEFPRPTNTLIQFDTHNARFVSKRSDSYEASIKTNSFIEMKVVGDVHNNPELI